MAQVLIEGVYDDYKKFCEKEGKDYDKSIKVKKVDNSVSKFPKQNAQPFYPKQYYFGYEDPYFHCDKKNQAKPQY
jgi:hypothetical protein